MSILLIVLLALVGLVVLSVGFFFLFFRVIAPRFFKEANGLFKKMERNL